jgi:hypothetical protein
MRDTTSRNLKLDATGAPYEGLVVELMLNYKCFLDYLRR